ncbi:hypothetical protein A2U01_0104677, partial [Trifolium medium]|nr:hypothetical protein [Trifolium medium]
MKRSLFLKMEKKWDAFSPEHERNLVSAATRP